ncbi:hypothetical protein CYMTET_42534, partial [Cymbomonas tetramitiformis]
MDFPTYDFSDGLEEDVRHRGCWINCITRIFRGRGCCFKSRSQEDSSAGRFKPLDENINPLCSLDSNSSYEQPPQIQLFKSPSERDSSVREHVALKNRDSIQHTYQELEEDVVADHRAVETPPTQKCAQVLDFQEEAFKNSTLSPKRFAHRRAKSADYASILPNRYFESDRNVNQLAFRPSLPAGTCNEGWLMSYYFASANKELVGPDIRSEADPGVSLTAPGGLPAAQETDCSHRELRSSSSDHGVNEIQVNQKAFDVLHHGTDVEDSEYQDADSEFVDLPEKTAISESQSSERTATQTSEKFAAITVVKNTQMEDTAVAESDLQKPENPSKLEASSIATFSKSEKDVNESDPELWENASSKRAEIATSFTGDTEEIFEGDPTVRKDVPFERTGLATTFTENSGASESDLVMPPSVSLEGADFATSFIAGVERCASDHVMPQTVPLERADSKASSPASSPRSYGTGLPELREIASPSKSDGAFQSEAGEPTTAIEEVLRGAGITSKDMANILKVLKEAETPSISKEQSISDSVDSQASVGNTHQNKLRTDRFMDIEMNSSFPLSSSSEDEGSFVDPAESVINEAETSSEAEMSSWLPDAFHPLTGAESPSSPSKPSASPSTRLAESPPIKPLTSPQNTRSQQWPAEAQEASSVASLNVCNRSEQTKNQARADCLRGAAEQSSVSQDSSLNWLVRLERLEQSVFALSKRERPGRGSPEKDSTQRHVKLKKMSHGDHRANSQDSTGEVLHKKAEAGWQQPGAACAKGWLSHEESRIQREAAWLADYASRLRVQGKQLMEERARIASQQWEQQFLQLARQLPGLRKPDVSSSDVEQDAGMPPLHFGQNEDGYMPQPNSEPAPQKFAAKAQLRDGRRADPALKIEIPHSAESCSDEASEESEPMPTPYDMHVECGSQSATQLVIPPPKGGQTQNVLKQGWSAPGRPPSVDRGAEPSPAPHLPDDETVLVQRPVLRTSPAGTRQRMKTSPKKLTPRQLGYTPSGPGYESQSGTPKSPVPCSVYTPLQGGAGCSTWRRSRTQDPWYRHRVRICRAPHRLAGDAVARLTRAALKTTAAQKTCTRALWLTSTDPRCHPRDVDAQDARADLWQDVDAQDACADLWQDVDAQD